MASSSGRYGGVVKIEGHIYLADKDNARIEEFLEFDDAAVEVDVDQVVAGKFTATLNGYRELTAYKTFFAPYLHVTYLLSEDPLDTGGYMAEDTMVRQLGLFTLLPMSRDFDGGKVTQDVEAWDMMWLVSQRYSQAAITLPVGTVVTNYVNARLSDLGFRHDVQTSGKTLTKEMTWQAGTSWVSIFNDLLDAIGYYHLWADRFGRIVSRPYQTISQMEEQTTFSTAYGDIGKAVRLEPDPEWIKNDVIVYGNNPGTTAISARATNTDRNSETSIYGLRDSDDQEPIYLTMTEDDSSIESTATALARAKKLLEERSSMFYRLEVETVPYPGLDMREPIRLEIYNDYGIRIANEKWWWDHLTIGFSPKSGGMKLRCNRLLPFEVEES